ncbi:MAG: hypothetical protein K2J85_01455 [Anaeroplasmataceae bacterium]|nr:hypothetical protein [Anaeroplasmataceae bacterium]
MKENQLRKYLFENIIFDTDITSYSEVKNPSNRYSWEITKNGEIHALKSHPEIEKMLPNLGEEVKKILDNPTKIEKDKKYINTITFIKKYNDTHHFRLSVLITPAENKIKSIRYQRTRKKDFETIK